MLDHQHKHRQDEGQDLVAIASRYDALAEWMDTVAWYRDEIVPKIVGQLVPPEARSGLEMCCGTGRLLAYLAEHSPTLAWTGVDVSEKMVNRARARLVGQPGVRIVHSNWLTMINDSVERAYDVVVVKNALHLLGNLTDHLRALHSITSWDASLIVVETVSPNKSANQFVWDLFGAIDAQEIKRHCFTIHGLKEQLASSGWACTREILVRQYIDVSDWLAHKCTTDASRSRGEEVFQSCKREVRRSMEFSPRQKPVPNQMLRLQMIAVCERQRAPRRFQLRLM